MRQDPFDAAQDRRNPAVTVSVQYLNVDDIRVRSYSDELAGRTGAIAGDRAGDMGTVATHIWMVRVTRAGEADRSEDAVASLGEVGVGGDTRVEDGNGHAATGTTLLPNTLCVDFARIERRQLTGRP